MQSKLKLLLAGSAVALASGAMAAKPSDCWMTGGGSVFNVANGYETEYSGRTTHGFELHCDTRNPNNLEINWPGNRFHLTDLTAAQCPDSDAIEPNPPDAAFDTFIGIGGGKLNGIPGAQIVFTFTDAGEPGVADTATISILDPNGNQVLYVSGNLYNGNHQAHSN